VLRHRVQQLAELRRRQRLGQPQLRHHRHHFTVLGQRVGLQPQRQQQGVQIRLRRHTAPATTDLEAERQATWDQVLVAGAHGSASRFRQTQY
jgi:hypothetical protein